MENPQYKTEFDGKIPKLIDIFEYSILRSFNHIPSITRATFPLPMLLYVVARTHYFYHRLEIHNSF